MPAARVPFSFGADSSHSATTPQPTALTTDLSLSQTTAPNQTPSVHIRTPSPTVTGAQLLRADTPQSLNAKFNINEDFTLDN